MEEFKVKKIVFSSSATVFGEPEYLPIDEIHPTGKCINPYGRTKYFFEEFLKDLNNSNKPGDDLVSKFLILFFSSKSFYFKDLQVWSHYSSYILRRPQNLKKSPF